MGTDDGPTPLIVAIVAVVLLVLRAVVVLWQRCCSRFTMLACSGSSLEVGFALLESPEPMQVGIENCKECSGPRGEFPSWK